MSRTDWATTEMIDEPLDLEAIRERFGHCELDDISSSDVSDLIAEVERLRAKQLLWYST